jgi:hypothetical protein
VPLPPKWVRRLVLLPVVLVVTVLLLAVSPAILAVGLFSDLFVAFGRWRTTRLVLFAMVYLILELIGFVALLALWVASGFGIWQRRPVFVRANYGFMRWWLKLANVAARRLFRLKIWIEDRPEPTPGPILVFSRNAGPGNSLMLIGTIMIGYQRQPRIVMLSKLQWEPLFDVMLNRLPNRFIDHDPKNRERYIDAIADLATGLGDRDAFVLFPEGHDFTPKLRVRAIESLKRKGHHESAQRAEGMQQVLPPRHGGVMSAIGAAPDADVVLVAHTVLEDVGSFKDLWGRIPLERPILSRYWRIPPDQVPRERDELIGWLFDWWDRIDGWITERRAAVEAGEIHTGGDIQEEKMDLSRRGGADPWPW